MQVRVRTLGPVGLPPCLQEDENKIERVSEEGNQRKGIENGTNTNGGGGGGRFPEREGPEPPVPSREGLEEGPPSHGKAVSPDGVSPRPAHGPTEMNACVIGGFLLRSPGFPGLEPRAQAEMHTLLQSFPNIQSCWHKSSFSK